MRAKQSVIKIGILNFTRGTRQRHAGKSSVLRRPRGIKSLFVIALMLVVSCILIAGLLVTLVRFTQTEFRNISDASTINPPGVVVENYGIYVVKQDSVQDKRFVEDVFVVSFNFREKTTKLIRVSPSYVVYVPYLGRTLGLSTVYNNAVLLGRDPYPAINSAVRNLLSIGINGYAIIESGKVGVIANQAGLSTTYHDLSGLISSSNIFNSLLVLYNTPQIAQHLNTTLDRNKLMGLLSNVFDFRHLGVVEIDGRYGVETKFSFGTGYTPDLNMINQVIGDIMHSSEVLTEQVKVEVFNASGESGLAFRTARLLTSYGVNVVRYANAPKGEAKTILHVPERTDAKINLALIRSLVKADIEVSDQPFEYNATGDIVLVLGSDIVSN